METGAAPKKGQEVGDILDDFTLPDVSGAQHKLSDLIQGKRGGVVMFWSGICSHCVRYDEWANEFAAKNPDIAFIAVASRQGETPEMISQTMKERGLSFTVLHDAGGALAKQWYTQQTPRVFLLDTDRKLLYRGAIDNFKYPADPLYEPYLAPAIEDFLAGRPVARTETASFGCAIQSLYYLLPKSI